MGARLICAVAALMAVSTVQAIEVYRWLDKNGKVVYSDIPPPANATNPELRRLGKNAVEVDRLPFATRDAVKKNPVTLYANNCGAACDSARRLLTERGIPHTVKNPDSSQTDREALQKLVGALEVPVLVVGNNAHKGYEAATWGAALDAAGYPRIAALAPPAAAKPAPAAASQSEAGSPAPKY